MKLIESIDIMEGLRFIASDGSVWQVINVAKTRFYASQLIYVVGTGWRHRITMRQFSRKHGKGIGFEIHASNFDPFDVDIRLKQLDTIREREDALEKETQAKEDAEREAFESTTAYKIAERIIHNMKGSGDPDVWVTLGEPLLLQIESRFIELGNLTPRKEGPQ